MLVRRLLILLAVLVVLTALASTIAPAPTPLLQATPTPTPTPQPRASAAPHATPAGGRAVRAALSAAPGGPIRRILARVGDRVSITVRSARIDTVTLGDLDVEGVEPGVPAHFDLQADDAGTYPLVLVDGGRRIATLVVR